MSEARTDTTQQRPQGAQSQGGLDHHGRHRGGAAPSETPHSSPHGRHRRPGDSGDAA
ncbi:MULTISPECIES: hypothetical protein [unclassified Streptomyces]|uniref:hypothetical protein n=1 Tax=unclassified Streptomyces TaxID=2593676 RepID=UPI00382E97E0